MKTKITNLWNSVSSSYWFIPAIMVLLSILFSFIMIYIDKEFIKYSWIDNFGLIFPNDPDGARAFLSTVAGSMITVAGVVFSITIVALTLASSQFGPRILINFMRDKGNQIVLGTFIATFVYCLVVLRTIKGGNDSHFIPNLSITFGALFTISSIGVLIYFIHHAASSIHVSYILSHISRDLENTIDRLFPERSHQDLQKKKWWNPPHELPKDSSVKKEKIFANKSGYIQAIDIERLLSISKSNYITIEIKNGPGDFVVNNQMIAELYTADNKKDIPINSIINSFILGERRTNEQDARFVMDQLVEIAVRALSPGVNDPFTAIMSIDRLCSALCLLAERSFPASHLYDDDNNLRLILKRNSFESFLDSAFNDIRYYSGSSVSVSKRVLEALGIIALRVKNDTGKRAVLKHAKLVKDNCKRNSIQQSDFEEIAHSYNKIESIIK